MDYRFLVDVKTLEGKSRVTATVIMLHNAELIEFSSTRTKLIELGAAAINL